MSQLKKTILLLSVLVACFWNRSFGAETGEKAPPCDSCRQFDQLNTLIRDRKIAKDEAMRRISHLLPGIEAFAVEHGAKGAGRTEWVFPVAGLNVTTAGNNKGSDYVPSGYDYFDGNAHGGHPSFDLFIHDKNQDGLDDRTAKPVHVLSMTGGIVVAAEPEWDAKSPLRGGKYLWIYDHAGGALVYYAHNDRLLVRVGDVVAPGTPIATVGRAGYNAHKKRSPTHLHLTYLRVKDGYPRPENIYKDLARAITPSSVPTPLEEPPTKRPEVK